MALPLRTCPVHGRDWQDHRAEKPHQGVLVPVLAHRCAMLAGRVALPLRTCPAHGRDWQDHRAEKPHQDALLPALVP